MNRLTSSHAPRRHRIILPPPLRTAGVVIAAAWMLSGELLHGQTVAESRRQGMRFGRAVLALGDIDGDGTNDVAVGAPAAPLGDRSRAGAVLVLSGRTRGLLDRWTSEHAVGFGHSLRALDDLNGDGAGEVLVGRPGIGPVDVRCGQTGASLFLLDAAARDAFQIGDVDGDSLGDFLLAGIRSLELRSGKDGSRLSTPLANRSVGELLPAGDLDGDGLLDGVVASTGEVILSGRTFGDGDEPLYAPAEREPLLALEDRVLQSLVSLPLKGRYAEVVAATSNASGQETLLSRLSLESPGSVRWSVPGPGRNNPWRQDDLIGHLEPERALGAAIGPAGDLDGDGLVDVWASEPCQFATVSLATYASSSGEVLYRSEWLDAGPYSGLAVAACGDENGDEAADLLVGTSTWSERSWVSNRGSVRLLSSKTGELLWLVEEGALQALADFLDGTRGKHPVLVLQGPKALLEEQVQLLANDYSGTMERDVIVVDISGETAMARIGDLPTRPASAVLRRQYEIAADQFQMVLVGKDGRVSKRYEGPVTADEIWKEIDTER